MRAARASRAARAVTVASAAIVFAGCAVPVPDLPEEAAPAPAQGDDGLELTTQDAAGAALADQLAALDAAVAAVAAALGAAATAGTAGDLDAARTAGTAAVELLLGAPGTAGTPEAAGLLPARAADRASGGADDLITATVTLAGDVGGERARVVLELVRDPLVGDLGAWQRDAPGVIDGLRATVAAAGPDAEALDEGLAVVAGELTRALGYALAVASAPDPALAVHAAEVGAARLEVVRVALELGVTALADGDA